MLFFAYLGSWFSNVAIFSMLVDFHSSAFLISFISTIYFLPSVLLSSFSGVIVDRVSVKTLLISCLFVEMSMTACFLFVTSLSDIWILAICLFIRMSSASIFFVSVMSFTPKVFDKKILSKINEIFSLMWSLTFILGMFLGGIAVDMFGVAVSFLIDISFFIVALFVLFFADIKVQVEHRVSNAFLFIKEGILYLRENKLIIQLIFVHSSIGLCAFESLITLLVDYEYKYIISTPLAIALMHSSRAFALFVGVSVCSKFANIDNIYKLFYFLGFSLLLFSLLQFDFYYALFGMFLVGISITSIWSFTYALLQENTQKQYLGRVLSYTEAIFMLSAVLFSIFSGAVASVAPLWVISATLGIIIFIIGLYYRLCVMGQLQK